MLLKSAISQRIKELLKEKNITQYQLYKNTGVPQSTISTILTEVDKTCKILTIAQIAQGLGIGLNDFFNSSLFDVEEIEID